jgi:hypothetical protein
MVRSAALWVLCAGVLLSTHLVAVHAANSSNSTSGGNSTGTSKYSRYYNGSDSGVCKVYSKTDIFTVIVQLMLGGFALGSLYVKRLQEKPRRTFRTWFLDVSKQAFGATYAHVLNMCIAGSLAHRVRGNSVVLTDQCAWYGLSYLMDTTLGLVLAVLGLRLLERLANQRNWAPLQHSGVYAGNTAIVHWSCQVLAWLFILTISKMVIYLIMWLCSVPLAYVGKLLFAPFQGYTHFELLFVMIFFPGFLNVIYFWIADGYLKAKADQGDAHENDETGLEDKKESLLSDPAETEMSVNQPAPWSSLSKTKEEAPSSTAAV